MGFATSGSADLIQCVSFWAYLFVDIQNGALYAMIAVGYTLVYGVLGLINFAHGDVFMWGGFGAAFLTRGILGLRVASGWATVGLSAGIAVGGLVSVFVAVSVERVAYRPLRRRHAPKLAFLISAIGASYFLETLAGKEFGYGENLFPAQIFPVGQTLFHVFGFPVRTLTIITVIAGAATLIVADRLVRATKLGRGIRAVAQDSETSSLMGVNIEKTITLTFIVGGALAGAAGLSHFSRAVLSGTPGWSSASTPSPRPSSVASATFAGPHSAAW